MKREELQETLLREFVNNAKSTFMNDNATARNFCKILLKEANATEDKPIDMSDCGLVINVISSVFEPNVTEGELFGMWLNEEGQIMGEVEHRDDDTLHYDRLEHDNEVLWIYVLEELLNAIRDLNEKKSSKIIQNFMEKNILF